jgi:hypothetical protein
LRNTETRQENRPCFGVLPNFTESGGGDAGHDLYCDGSFKGHDVSDALAGAAQLLATVHTVNCLGRKHRVNIGD